MKALIWTAETIAGAKDFARRLMLMMESLLFKQYGLHLISEEKSKVGAGSDTWFLNCLEGKFVLKFPATSEINHPELEPELCAFLRENGVPACVFLKNTEGKFVSIAENGACFTLQRLLPGITPAWNTASDDLLMESAQMLGKIHKVLQDYPPLPTGIGADFFTYMTPEHALDSYNHSLSVAKQIGNQQDIAELEWRIAFMKHFPAWSFDLEKLTLRNTHGDYFISQFLCENGHLTSIIDWTTACVHPAIWEIMRSFVYSAPCCAKGEIDKQLFKRYLDAYCCYGTLNDYDIQNLYKLYFYQIAVCDYYGQYYASNAQNREIYLQQARLATKLLKNMESII